MAKRPKKPTTTSSTDQKNIDNWNRGQSSPKSDALKKAGILGSEGEAAVRSVFDIGDKSKIFVNGRGRIPDGIMPGESLSEVKNVDKLSLTSQIRDYLDHSQKENLRFDLYTRQNTDISRPLQKLIDDRDINRISIP